MEITFENKEIAIYDFCIDSIGSLSTTGGATAARIRTNRNLKVPIFLRFSKSKSFSIPVS